MRRWMAGCLLMISTVVWASDQVEIGRRIYTEGVLPSGELLSGIRPGGEKISGQAAACVSCHRRSGMGAVEGTLLVPPIAGSFLFGNDPNNLVTMDQRWRKIFNQAHEPYNEDTLARAVRSGINSDGREMNVVMPRFELDDSQMQAVSAYLKQLSSSFSAGATADTVHFATVITPDVEPARRDALVRTLKTAFAQKNGSTVTGRNAGGRRRMVTASELVLGTQRNWTLDIWELKGPAETWGQQLAEFNRKQPVFALISGVSNGTWAPVHEFCQSEKIPCWFPSVPMPETDKSFYSLYFSRGMSLEADILAKYLIAKKGTGRLIQVVNADPVSVRAARVLAERLENTGIKVEQRTVQGDHTLRQALTGIGHKDAVMLWLRSADLATLSGAPAVAGDVYLSAQYSGAEHVSLSDHWKSHVHMVYEYELPARRAAGLSTFYSWLKLAHIPLVDDLLQSEAYFAVSFLSDVQTEMLNNEYRDYLLERAEYMLSLREGIKSEQEGRDRAQLGGAGELAIRNPGRTPMASTANLANMKSQSGRDGFVGGTTIYPHLSLAIGQRFASKGGYIVHFNAKGGLVADTDLIVP